MKLIRAIVCLCIILLWGCAGTPFEPAATIDSVEQTKGYRASNLITSSAQDAPMFVIVMFSGGGSRAAAMGYEVLDVLRQQTDGQNGHLLDHVALTFGVSGGSVISMYYALHGADTFPQFEQEFLKQNFQGNLLERFFSSNYLFGLASPEYGRGDLLAKEFDEHLFHGVTFGDVLAHGKGPMAVITASDLTAGYRFNFIQDYFDVLCLNLNEYSVARAVAASSAVPAIFSPITINNHAGHCNYRPSALLANAEQSSDVSVPTDLAVVRSAYSDSHKRPYLHLVDGGVSDNLGLRTLLDFTYVDDKDEALPVTLNQHEKVVLISVDAARNTDYSIDKSAQIPALTKVMEHTIDNAIDRFSNETLRQFERYLASDTAHLPKDVYFIHLRLADLPPSALRDEVQSIDTSFNIQARQIRALHQAVAVLFDQSEAYQRLLNSL